MNGVGADGENFTELDRFARNTYSREQEDLARILEALKQQELPQSHRIATQRLALVGHSRGGANSLLFALEHREVDQVVLWNSIARPDLFSPELKERIRREGRATIPNARTGQTMPIDREVLDDLETNRARYDLLQRAKGYEKPVLILHGDADLSVPPDTAKKTGGSDSQQQNAFSCRSQSYICGGTPLSRNDTTAGRSVGRDRLLFAKTLNRLKV